jgi:hypothetical protein
MIIRRWRVSAHTWRKDWPEMAALADALEQDFLLRSSARRAVRSYGRLFNGLPLDFGIEDRWRDRWAASGS